MVIARGFCDYVGCSGMFWAGHGVTTLERQVAGEKQAADCISLYPKLKPQ